MFGLERIEFLERNWRSIAETVLRRAREVIVFSSVIKGRATGASDLDLAVIVRGLNRNEVSRLLLEIHARLPDEISEIIDLVIIAEEDESEFLKFVGDRYVVIR
ncbi:nucleotidyltransferase domain-containing protein [Vulcanisaeta sp. EB80]|uniref:nucleotidyltransferase domain-containing protein n=1 Tax=Vulcanisaeta sp. EB80 TaxID=1650660 RepID=UPI00192E4759|nr:nucleotidyltransferase domain-containing protein [Vulcanisaeta sp. EB80]